MLALEVRDLAARSLLMTISLCESITAIMQLPTFTLVISSASCIISQALIYTNPEGLPTAQT